MPGGPEALHPGVDQRRTIDALVAGGLAVLAVLEISLTRDEFSVRPHAIEALAVAAAMCAGLLWRRRLPLVTAAVAFAGVSTSAALDLAPQAWLVPYLCVVAYSAGAFAGPWESVLGLVASVGASWVVASSAVDGAVAIDYLWAACMLGVSWAAGFALRRREASARAARREALEDERARLARELHDVIAHSLTVIAVTSDAAELAVRRDPALAEKGLQTIRGVARDALTEMRRLVGIVRAGDPDSREPPPGLALLDELVGRVRATGLPVVLALHGDLSTLPPGVDLAAYRIVQEALTNARKHAGQASGAWVTVRRTDSGLEIEVVNDGDAATMSTHDGHGLTGLAERVARYDGRFEAAPLAAGGFRVSAALPVPASG